jgi:hypothetical protein
VKSTAAPQKRRQGDLVKLNGINKQRVNNFIYFAKKKETHYAERDFRPFLRLRARTLLPPTEDILERKPCLFFIFLLLG